MSKQDYTRRRFLKALGAGAAVIATTDKLFAGQKQDGRPNILWILSEDISPDLSCYGTEGVQTPNLDKLAGRGIRFTNTFTPVQAMFMAMRKPDEELYDIKKDPHEINNVAASPQHRQTLEKMRAILERWIEDTGDMGRFPEKPGSITPRDREKIYGQ